MKVALLHIEGSNGVKRFVEIIFNFDFTLVFLELPEDLKSLRLGIKTRIDERDFCRSE